MVYSIGMGIFDTIFGGGKRDSRFPNVATIHRSIHDEFYALLNEDQRGKLEELLTNALHHGGITHARVKGTLRHALRKLRDDHTFSETEYQSIMRWLRAGA